MILYLFFLMPKKTSRNDKRSSWKITLETIQNENQKGLPWWLSGKEFTCQCRRHGFDPWSSKVPHAVQQLSLCTQLLSLWSRAQRLYLLSRAHVPQLLEPPYPEAHAPPQQKPPQWEACALQLESSPSSLQLEKNLRSNENQAQL